MNSEKDTLPTNKTILIAIQNLQTDMNDFRQDVNEKFEEVDRKFEEVDRKFEKIDERFQQNEYRFEDMRLQLMSFDVRIDRLEANSYKMLDIAINTRADVKVLTEEVRAWSKVVADIQLRMA